MLTVLQWGDGSFRLSFTSQLAQQLVDQGVRQVEPDVGVVTQIWTRTHIAGDSAHTLIRNALRNPI